LLARAELLPPSDVVLSHFSTRYGAADVQRILERKLPDSLRESVRVLPTPTQSATPVTAGK
jgi:hypothetical protein